MKLPEIDQSILPWIGKTGKWMGIYISEKFKKYQLKLTLEQWVVLKILHEEDGRMQNDLAIVTKRNKTSLTRLINTMERNHLVARIPDTTDKRVNRVFLTKNGRKVFASTFFIIEEVKQELQAGLEPKEIETLIHLLQKVQNNLKKYQNSCSTN